MTRIQLPLKSHASAWLFAALIGSLWFGCTSAPSPQPIARPLTPIQMKADTTTLHLSDFASILPVIDSVKWENGALLPITQLGEERVVQLTEQPRRQVGFLQLWSGGGHTEVPVFKTTKEPVELMLLDYQAHESVQVIGSFTNWQANPIEMDGSQGYHGVDLMLDKGTHL